MSLWSRHAIFEKNSIVLVIGVLIVISIGGLVEIVPLFYLKSTIEKVSGIRPYTPLALAAQLSGRATCARSMRGARRSKWRRRDAMIPIPIEISHARLERRLRELFRQQFRQIVDDVAQPVSDHDACGAPARAAKTPCGEPSRTFRSLRLAFLAALLGPPIALPLFRHTSTHDRNR